MSEMQNRILKTLRMKLSDLYEAGLLKVKDLVVAYPSDLLSSSLPKLDKAQQSVSNPDGVTAILLLAEGDELNNVNFVDVIDARRIVTAFYLHKKFMFDRNSERMSTEVLIQSFCSLPMGKVAEYSSGLESVKSIDINESLASVMGEFGSRYHLVITSVDEENRTSVKFVFSIRDFLQMFDNEDLALLGDKLNFPNELNSTPIIHFSSTLGKPLSFMHFDAKHLLCCSKEENITQALSKLVLSHHRGMPVLGDLTTPACGINPVNIISTSDFVTYLLHWDEFMIEGIDLLSSSVGAFASAVKQFINLQVMISIFLYDSDNIYYIPGSCTSYQRLS